MRKQKEGEVAYYKLTPAERDIITDHINRRVKAASVKVDITPEEKKAVKLLGQVFMRLHRLHPDPVRSIFGRTYFELEMTPKERRQLVRELVARQDGRKVALDLIAKLADPGKQTYRKPVDDVTYVESLVQRF